MSFSTKAKGEWATSNQICQSKTIYKEAQNKVVILDFLNWRRVALFLFHCVSKASRWALISAVHLHLMYSCCIEQSCLTLPSPHWSKVKTWTKYNLDDFSPSFESSLVGYWLVQAELRRDSRSKYKLAIIWYLEAALVSGQNLNNDLFKSNEIKYKIVPG